MRRRLIATTLAVLALTSCKTAGLSGSCADLGDGAEAQKLEAFIATGVRFERDALALERDVEATCAAMAADLGLSVPRATEDELQVEVTCGVLGVEIQAIIDAALPAGATLEVIYEPPVCSFAIDAMASCVAECDVNVTADVNVMCTEGRLAGGCSGSCTGECRLEGEIACDARCEGSCTGSCTGSCIGACEGECSAFDSEGNCAGTCTGTCSGTCTGSCSGTCTGTCTADVEGSCTGTCSGSCDVDFEAPRCEGDARIEADVQCEAACEASVAARAECTEPSVSVYSSVEVDPAAQARLAELVTTLRTHYPRLLGLQARLVRVAETGAELVVTFRAAATAASRLSVTAGLCFADSVSAAVNAVSSIDASLSVTIEVSASISATAR